MKKTRLRKKAAPGELPEAASACQKSLFDTLVDGEQAIHNSQWSPCCAWRLAAFPPLLLYKSPKTEAASRGEGQLIAKVVQWKGNGLTDSPKSFALYTREPFVTA